MRDVAPPILTPWLRCLVAFALSSIAFTIILVWIGHSTLGDMRPMNGFFVLGVASFAALVAVLVAARYLLTLIQRNTD